MATFPSDFTAVYLHYPQYPEHLLTMYNSIKTLELTDYTIVNGYTSGDNPYTILPDINRSLWAQACGLRQALKTALSKSKPYILYIQSDAVFESDVDYPAIKNKINNALDILLENYKTLQVLYGGYTNSESLQGNLVVPYDKHISSAPCILFAANIADRLAAQIDTQSFWQVPDTIKIKSVTDLMSAYFQRVGIVRHIILPSITKQTV